MIANVAGRALGTRDMHLFATLGQARGLFRAWLYYSSRMMPFGVLPRRETELIILRVACQRGCDYERIHHTKLGQRAGLSRDEISRISLDPQLGGWSAREELLLNAADELVHDADISDLTWAQLEEYLRPKQLVGLVMLIVQYDGLATAMATLRIQPDVPR